MKPQTHQGSNASPWAMQTQQTPPLQPFGGGLSPFTGGTAANPSPLLPWTGLPSMPGAAGTSTTFPFGPGPEGSRPSRPEPPSLQLPSLRPQTTPNRGRMNWGPAPVMTTAPLSSQPPAFPSFLPPLSTPEVTPALGAQPAMDSVPYSLAEGYIRRADLEARARGSLLGEQLLGRSPAPRNETGQVMIFCDQALWRQVRRYLRCGAIPAQTDPELLAQARAFGLSDMVERLEAGLPGVSFHRFAADAEHFRARFTFCGVAEALARGQDLTLAVSDSDNLMWTLTVNRPSFTLEVGRADPDSPEPPLLEGHIRLSLRAQGDQTKTFDQRAHLRCGASTFQWVTFQRSLDEWLSEEVALHRGGLVIELDVARLPLSAHPAEPVPAFSGAAVSPGPGAQRLLGM